MERFHFFLVELHFAQMHVPQYGGTYMNFDMIILTMLIKIFTDFSQINVEERKLKYTCWIVLVENHCYMI